MPSPTYENGVRRGKFWRWLCRLAYRRMMKKAAPESRVPLGVPAIRDPMAPCDAYAPRPWKPGDWRDCWTDGHYLCLECCHMSEGAKKYERKAL